MHCDYVRMNIHNIEQFMIPGIAYTMGLYLPFSVLTSHYFNSLESILWHFATIHNFLHKHSILVCVTKIDLFTCDCHWFSNCCCQFTLKCFTKYLHFSIKQRFLQIVYNPGAKFTECYSTLRDNTIIQLRNYIGENTV